MQYDNKKRVLKRGPATRRKRRRSFIYSLALLLFCILLLTGCWHFFFNRPAAEPDIPYEQTGIPEVETADDYSAEEAEIPDPVTEETTAGDEGEAAPTPVAAPLKVIADGNDLLALVSKETTLKAGYAPTDLDKIPGYMNPSRELWLREEALAQLKSLWQAAYEDGVTLKIISAYRSYDYQQTLFQNYADRHGAEEANRFSARAGQSEHQLGTTVDFGGTDVDFKAAYAETPQGRWLAANAHQFGFAMSYPAGKEAITGYIFEPWHYRYIGLEAARQWYESGLTLKEFLQTKPQQFE